MSSNAFSFTADEAESLSQEMGQENAYVADPRRGLELIASLLPQGQNPDHSEQRQALATVRDILSRRIWDVLPHTGVDLGNAASQLEMLVSQLQESHKIRLLQGRSIIGMGGQFSAGKSGFINSLLGAHDQKALLMEDQTPTTSIPTYLTYGRDTEINAYCGMRVVPMDLERLQAITYDFYRKYKIGFSRYVSNIVIHTADFPEHLKERVVLLDTPGYNNSREDETSRLTDREIALDQLRIADFVIWLADINNGTITQDDLSFIHELDKSTPILFVFTKADQKIEEQVDNTVRETENTLKDSGINVFGVTAYSSHEHQEYLGRHLINDFLNTAADSQSHRHDPLPQIDALIERMHQALLSHGQRISEEHEKFARVIKSTWDASALELMAFVYSTRGEELAEHRKNLQSFQAMIDELKEALGRLQLRAHTKWL